MNEFVNTCLSFHTKIGEKSSYWLFSLFPVCLFSHRDIKNLDQREADKKRANRTFIPPSVLNEETLEKKPKEDQEKESAFLLRFVGKKDRGKSRNVSHVRNLNNGKIYKSSLTFMCYSFLILKLLMVAERVTNDFVLPLCQVFVLYEIYGSELLGCKGQETSSN